MNLRGWEKDAEREWMIQRWGQMTGGREGERSKTKDRIDIRPTSGPLQLFSRGCISALSPVSLTAQQ